MADRSTTPEGHSVSPEGALLRTSPSQIKTADLCLRAWWFDKVGHLPRKQIAAQQVGTETHAQLEHYLGTGQNVLGPIALAGKHLLPEPGKDLVIEAPIMPLEIEGIPVIGYVDLVNPRELPGVIEVIDHKTTSSIERYAKGVDELLQDPQLAIYCTWALRRWPAQRARFAHIYYQTRGARRAEKVIVDLTRDVVGKTWAATGAKVRAMQAAAREKDPAHVPCSPEACSAYGGCSYLGACPASPVNRFSKAFIERKESMSLMDRLKAKSAAPAIPPPAASATPPPAEKPAETAAPAAPAATATPAPAAPATTSAAGQLLAKDCKIGEVYQLPADPPAGRAEATFGEAKGPAGSWALFQTAAGIARVRGTDPVYTPDAKIPEAPAPAPAVKPDIAAVVPPDAPKSAPPAEKPAETAAAPAPAVEAPKKRGRPAKAATLPAPGTAGPEAVKAAAEANTEADAFVLLVNCVSSQSAQDLSGYVARLAADAAKVAGVEDVRIDDKGPMAFGKWKGYLAEMARANPPKGRCMIFSGDLADPVIEALASVADEVVRGR